MNKYTRKMNAEGTNPPCQWVAPTGSPAHQDCWRRDGAGGLRRVEKEETQEWE